MFSLCTGATGDVSPVAVFQATDSLAISDSRHYSTVQSFRIRTPSLPHNTTLRLFRQKPKLESAMDPDPNAFVRCFRLPQFDTSLSDSEFDAHGEPVRHRRSRGKSKAGCDKCKERRVKVCHSRTKFRYVLTSSVHSATRSARHVGTALNSGFTVDS